MKFPSDASIGPLRASIDFDISADRNYKFTVYRPYELGLGDVNLFASYRITPQGVLEIEQTIVNRTDPLEVLNFDCILFIPGQRRQKRLVTKLRQGVDKKFYYVPDANLLRGKKLRLRAEQIDGRRVLNFPVTLPE